MAMAIHDGYSPRAARMAEGDRDSVSVTLSPHL